MANYPQYSKLTPPQIREHDREAASVGSDVIDWLCNNEDIDQRAHNFACDHLSLPRTTLIGRPEGTADNIPRTDLQFPLYWEHFARFHTKVLLAALQQNNR